MGVFFASSRKMVAIALRCACANRFSKLTGRRSAFPTRRALGVALRLSWIAAFLLSVLLLSASDPLLAQVVTRPNIVVIMTDDQDYPARPIRVAAWVSLGPMTRQRRAMFLTQRTHLIQSVVALQPRAAVWASTRSNSTVSADMVWPVVATFRRLPTALMTAVIVRWRVGIPLEGTST
jgi:hypothetical protein